MFNFLRYWFKNPKYNPEKLGNLYYSKLLYKGKAYGFDYYVVDRNITPCAYIKIPCNHYLFAEDRKDIPDELHEKVHGGITWADSGLMYYKHGKKIYNKDSWFIGWDYGHLGDRLCFTKEGKTWKTREIVEECKKMCKVLANATTMKIAIKDKELKEEFENMLRELEEDLNGRLSERVTEDKSRKENRKWR